MPYTSSLFRMPLFALLGLAALLACAGCTSFYSSAITGYESVAMPILPDVEGRRLALGFEAQTTPTNSIFTHDFTNSVMGTAFVRARLAENQGQTFYLRGTISEYYAINSLASDQWVSGELPTNYEGYGTVVGLRPSLVTDLDVGRLEVAVNALVNREFGDYLGFRNTLPRAGFGVSGKVDVSPNGQTASTLVEFAFEPQANPKLTLGAGLGFAFFDFLKAAEGNGIAKLGATYREGNVWTSISTQIMPPLNLGLVLGFGVSVY